MKVINWLWTCSYPPANIVWEDLETQKYPYDHNYIRNVVIIIIILSFNLAVTQSLHHPVALNKWKLHLQALTLMITVYMQRLGRTKCNRFVIVDTKCRMEMLWFPDNWMKKASGRFGSVS